MRYFKERVNMVDGSEKYILHMGEGRPKCGRKKVKPHTGVPTIKMRLTLHPSMNYVKTFTWEHAPDNLIGTCRRCLK